MISKMKFVGCDEKVRKYLMPVRILWQSGTVKGVDLLFREKDIQISVSEPESMELINDESKKKAAILLDFGFEIAGGVKILTESCKGNSNPEIRLCFGESANEAMSRIGEKNSTNDHATRDMKVRLPRFSDMEFGQTGFRFLKIELLSKNTTVRIKSILAVLTYRDLEYKGTFQSSDEVLNRIFDVSAYTCHLNMQNQLWDGIKRDRLVWIGDMHPEMLTIRTIFGYDKCIEQGLDLAKRLFPLPEYSNFMVTYSMWWLKIIWDWYWHNGRLDYINSSREYIISLLDQLCGLIGEDGEDTLPQYGSVGYFLDWPTLEKPEAKAGTRALFGMALEAGVNLCLLLKEEEAAERCREKAALLRKCVPSQYGVKSAAALMVLAGHISPKLAASEVLLPGGPKGYSTFMSYYQLTALAEADCMKDALSVLKAYYGGMLEAGATTFWEDFDVDWLIDESRIDKLSPAGKYNIHADNGVFCYTGYRHSLCHGWSSAPTAFLAERVLGIQIVEAGCKKIRISPDLGNLEWAKGSYPTPYGNITVSHSKETDGKIVTEFTVPQGVTVVENSVPRKL